ncbi:thioredoxin family protein [Enterovibrio sp. FF113]|uniref:thioredoxin family protein n=1 Tax=Enterovibrio sp. FF113 TaxID=3230010 RepID=UPI00352CCA23
MIQATTTGFNPDYAEDGPTIEEVQALQGIAIIEFGAPWCGYCQAAEPAVKEALAGLSIPHIKVYDGKGKRLGRSFNVKLWPTLILLNDGVDIERVVRPIHPDEIGDLLTDVDT